MRLRKLSIPSIDPSALQATLSILGFSAHLAASSPPPPLTTWLSTSPILSLLSPHVPSAIQLSSLPPGFIWSKLDPTHWRTCTEMVSYFTWHDRSPSDISDTLDFARKVATGEETMGDTVGDPILFIATLRQDCVHGQRVTALLCALSVMKTVVACGGELIWQRFSVGDDSVAATGAVDVVWENGMYRVALTWWQRLWARRRGRVTGKARALSVVDGKFARDGGAEMGYVEFARTADVALAAMWLGITVREVSLAVVKSLLDSVDGALLKEYADAEGIDLADVIAVGGETGVHCDDGLVVIAGERVFIWPDWRAVGIGGYCYRCDWDLSESAARKGQRYVAYHYLRSHCHAELLKWQTGVNHETYWSRDTLLGMLLSVLQFAVFFFQASILRRKHARVNMRDAASRIGRKGMFVESSEITSEAPSVSDTMVLALSDRIPVDIPVADVSSAFDRCFGEDVIPSGAAVRDDEQVIVLSYRHESLHVRMQVENWQYCYLDLSQVAIAHGKKAIRVWTDKLASNTRGDSLWLESGVEPYRNAVVVAFNGGGDSIFVDRFWLSLERNTALRAWGYWLRDDLGQLMRLGTSEYPACTDDVGFLTQILFTPGRADGPLWENDRLEVIREVAKRLNIVDADSLWDAITSEFLPTRYTPFDVVDGPRIAGKRTTRGEWSPAADVLFDRELIEKALGFEVRDRTEFTVMKWIGTEKNDRVVAVKSLVSEDWFCASVQVSRVGTDMSWRVDDVVGRTVVTSADLKEAVMGLQQCNEKWT